MEHLISEGKVGGAGLSDLHPPVFFSIYNEATIKPTSIQVRCILDSSSLSLSIVYY